MTRHWISCAFAAVLVAFGPFAGDLEAQPSGNQMCGDGTTFHVTLPGKAMLPDLSVAPDASIDLPKNCAIYALLVSGYSRNKDFNELTFYSFAKFVAEHNGYVHYAWWNNLLKPYMEGPLHNRPINLAPLGTFGATPGGLAGVTGLGFIPPAGFGNSVDTVFPKAIPEEDDQFQADAEAMLQAIRANNPNAIIVVAGHSMGGDAVGRLGASTNVPIDLLAPIDPVGNRTYPVGNTEQNYNWTRWRATRTFKGYRQVDCTRDGPLNTCKDFDSRFLFKEYHCGPVGPLLATPPLVPSKAPGLCKGPWVDPGTRVKIRSNVRHLLHRWQRENTFPFDYDEDWTFIYQGTDTASVPGPLVAAQEGLGKNAVFEADPQKTCAAPPPPLPKKDDPRDSTLICNSSDGHGEIVGFRGLDAGGAVPIGLRAGNWPTPTTAAFRRAALIEMVTAPSPSIFKVSTDPPAWEHEPANPNLDMVVDDMRRILEKIFELNPPTSLDNTAPITVSSLEPSPNQAEWLNSDVDVTFNAEDDLHGSGVKDVSYFLAGAQAGGTTTAGHTAHETITAEGVTTVVFSARDHAGNDESPQTFDIRIDKTLPVVQAVPDVPPNPAGWNKTNVLVRFEASDAVSGVAASAADVLVTSEGAAQEIAGGAVDHAGNEAAAALLVSIDKTPPSTAVTTPPNGAVYPLGTSVNAAYTCADALSGVASCHGPVANGSPLDTATAGQKQFVVSATDAAGNSSELVRKYSVVLGQPRVIIAVTGKGRDAGGRFYLDLEFRNGGSGHARALTLKTLVLRTLAGTGTVALNAALSPALPVAVGNVDIGSATTQRFYFDLPSTVLRFSITESGTTQDAVGKTFSFSATQAVIP